MQSVEISVQSIWDESGTQESCPMGRGVIGELVECPLYVCLI